MSKNTKKLDIIKNDNNGSINISRMQLDSIAFDLDGTSEALSDIGYLMSAVINGQLNEGQVKSLARLIQTNAETWAEIAERQKSDIEDIAGKKAIA
ncbi:hypothetical protein PSAR109036_00670 [Psychrobacter arenosus]|uniref:hypothetical protein n=1 Tax=Psychrobacter arenosus TaxID=256326 RepID=UPI0019196DD4|nr:hypothetical protein [Psychrobacter arenosus]